MTISAADLASMAAEQALFMPDVATVVRQTITLDDAGDQVISEANAYTNRPCEATPRVLREIAERETGEEIKSGVRWNVVFALGTVIKTDDRLIVTNLETGLVQTLHVTAILAHETFSTGVAVNAVKTE